MTKGPVDDLDDAADLPAYGGKMGIDATQEVGVGRLHAHLAGAGRDDRGRRPPRRRNLSRIAVSAETVGASRRSSVWCGRRCRLPVDGCEDGCRCRASACPGYASVDVLRRRRRRAEPRSRSAPPLAASAAAPLNCLLVATPVKLGDSPSLRRSSSASYPRAAVLLCSVLLEQPSRRRVSPSDGGVGADRAVGRNLVVLDLLRRGDQHRVAAARLVRRRSSAPRPRRAVPPSPRRSCRWPLRPSCLQRLRWRVSRAVSSRRDGCWNAACSARSAAPPPSVGSASISCCSALSKSLQLFDQDVTRSDANRCHSERASAVRCLVTLILSRDMQNTAMTVSRLACCRRSSRSAASRFTRRRPRRRPPTLSPDRPRRLQRDRHRHAERRLELRGDRQPGRCADRRFAHLAGVGAGDAAGAEGDHRQAGALPDQHPLPLRPRQRQSGVRARRSTSSATSSRGGS